MDILELQKELQTKIDGFKEAVSNSATKEELDALKEDVNALKGEDKNQEFQEKISNLEGMIAEQADKLSKMKPGGGVAGRQPLSEQFKAALQTKEWEEWIERGAKGNSPLLQLKDINWGGVDQVGGVVQNYMPFSIPIYPLEEGLDMRSILPMGNSDSGTLEYPQEKAYTDGMGVIAESAASSQTDITFEMVTENAHRVATHATVSRRALRNTSWLSQYLASRFTEKFVSTLNYQVLLGDGVGENFNGLYNRAASYAVGGSLANIIPTGESTLIDSVIAMKSQLKEYTNITANVVFVHPTTATQLLLQKATNREFVWSEPISRVDANGYNYINGMMIIESKDIPVGEALVGYVAPTTVQLFNNGPIDMSSSESHGDNFISSLVTFRFEADLLFPVYRENAFLKGDLAAVQADITV